MSCDIGKYIQGDKDSKYKIGKFKLGMLYEKKDRVDYFIENMSRSYKTRYSSNRTYY